MKKFISMIAAIILIIYIGIKVDVEKLYPERDELTNIYVMALEDETYLLKIRGQVQDVLEQHRSSIFKKDPVQYMANLSKGYQDYQDDRLRDYGMVKDEIEAELRNQEYHQLSYQIQLLYPTTQGILVRAEKQYDLKSGKSSVSKRLIEDFWFIREEGTWKIRGIRTVSTLI